MAEPTDHHLLHRFHATRDPDAFTALVERHIHLVHGIARRSAHNQHPADADDITQAVFLLLSQKPPHLSANTTLTGWLFRATRYCCLNAQKRIRRRRHHELRAADAERAGGPMPTDPLPDDLLHHLDEALATLPRTLRDAVLLRYLEGRSVEESSARLGISLAAAGKRATRGLDKLRTSLAARGYSASPSIIVSILATETAKSAPHHLAASITATFATGTVSASVAPLAHAAAKAMTAAVSKFALLAGATLALSIAAGTFAVRTHRLPSPTIAIAATVPAAPETPPEPATLPAPPPPADEAHIAGNTNIAVYSLLLDPAAADQLRATLKAIPANASFYTLHRANAQRVREALQRATHDQHFLAPSTFFRRMSITGHVTNLGTDAEFFQIERPNAKYDFDFKHVDAADPSPDHKSLQLHLHFDLQNADLNWTDPATREEAHILKPAAIQWDGPLAPGDALVLLGDFGEWPHDHLLTATIYEVFNANDEQERRINTMFTTAAWIQQGPTGARALADRAWTWGHQDTRPPADIRKTAAAWTRTLSDGTTLRLLGISRPSRWPYCWWDADGLPTPAAYLESEIDFATPLAVALSVQRKDGSVDDRDIAFERIHDGRGLAVPESTHKLSVYVAAGPWTEHPLKRGESLALGDHSVNITTIGPWGPGHSTIILNGDWDPDYQLKIRAVLKDGKILDGPSLRESAISIPEASGPMEGDAEWFASPAKNIDHYLIATRHRELATLDNFATTPHLLPPDITTVADKPRAPRMHAVPNASQK